MYLGVSGGRAHRGVLGRPPRPLDEAPLVLLDDLGMSPLGWAPLAVLAALVTSTSLVLLMTFFPSLLSGFLAYLYTWYCFPDLNSLENRMQTIPLEVFY